ncbi:DUF4011 domain-containing protein [Alkalicella caledoniensis]|uniref:DUF4011 domain-containing protein n=1 Tax=Alkalicella caledoniensis TaxID=2731377 RepID=A0A7G9W5Y7_ALKCA|nr:AAA domain-containing protein [Alkalicella caledoniensis]QNO14099.1 DUF4011 domain-containing protein [Alkalicella caledoniensis]
MKDIFRKYKERLINLSSRNRSLVMKKIYKKRAFDLAKLQTNNNQLTEKILEFLISRQKRKLLVLDDPYKERIDRINKLEERIRVEKDYEVKKLENVKDVEEREHTNKLLIKDYTEKLNLEKEKIENDIKKIIDYSTSLTYLDREINALEKETGRYELYVGFPFVEGKFQDNSLVRAPIFLIPVRILKENNKWYIQNIMEQDILINKVFIYGYSKYNENKLKEFQTEFTTFELFDKDIVGSVIRYLDAQKIVIQDTEKREIERFADYTDKNIPDYKTGEIILKNHLILGQFPISNSIYNDYQILEQGDTVHKLLEKLLLNASETEKHVMDNDREEKLTLSEEEVYFLSPLDYSQENAVNEVNKTEQLVIYGPPGTGKSQTIANIIGDSLAKGKKVLMVSQKRAALDVIYNRLSDLSSKIILIHDANKDKKAFYDKVSKVIDEISHPNENSSISKTIKDKALKIDQGIESLEKIGNTLHQPRDFGITLQQMYSKSESINSKEDNRYEGFKKFRTRNKYRNYNYKQLKEAIDNITDNATLENYIEYKKMLSENLMLKVIKSNYDYIKSQEISENIEIFTEYRDQIKMQCPEDKRLFNKLIEKLKEKDYNLNSEDLETFVDNINKDINCDLLVQLNDGKWWSIRYWLNYKKNKLQEKENLMEFENSRRKLYAQFKQWNMTIDGIMNALEPLKSVIIEGSYYDMVNQLLDGKYIVDKLQKIENAIDKYQEFKLLAHKISVNNELENQLLEDAGSRASTVDDLKGEINLIMDFVILEKTLEIEKTLGDTALLDYTRFNDLKAQINTLMAEKNELTPSLILNEWNAKEFKYLKSPLFREYKRQANKKRMLWPIRKYISEFDKLIFSSFPCWLLSPETVSDILPFTKDLFDIIIFDEASQIFIENSLPTIYRGNRVVIAGDDKQLKPSSTFKAKFDDIEEEEFSLENAAALEEESLLDLAKVNYDSVHLNYHYRSQFEELINFSNYAFYNGRLQVSPNIKNSNSSDPAIQRIKVKGKWLDRKNTEEAEKVVEIVSQILKERADNQTIGVITFNISQKDLIQDLLDKRASSDPEFKIRYAHEIDRKKGNEDVSFFVKNIENVQGDERDIIIFSVGYARNEQGRVSVNFGSLSQDGGENRLNVAISRAKHKVLIVTSIEPEELNVDSTKNLGPKLFKKYLQYAREVSEGSTQKAKEILFSLIDTKIEFNKGVHYDSDLEMEVRNALIAKGYDVHTQVGVSGYKIDLAIYDEVASKYIFGIECDGATYHSSKSARERDIHRQRYLESRGWNITRIWSRDWWRNSKEEVNKIDAIIKLHVEREREKLKKQLTQGVAKLDKKGVNARLSGKEITVNKFINTDLMDKKKIWYGDRVVLKDLESQETFEIYLEENQFNHQLMKDIELTLLGHDIDQIFCYKGYEYEVVRVEQKLLS